MADVYEIQRSEFDRLAKENRWYCHTDVVPNPEYVVASAWSEFGYLSHYVHLNDGWCSDFSTLERACEFVDCLTASDFRALGCGWTNHANEYEVWHIVDDAPKVATIALPVDADGRPTTYHQRTGEALPPASSPCLLPQSRRLPP